MNIYLLTTKYNGYDSYSGAVIIAPNEYTARKMAMKRMSDNEQREYIMEKHIIGNVVPKDISDYSTRWNAYVKFREEYPEINVWLDKEGSTCELIGITTEELNKSEVILTSYHAG